MKKIFTRVISWFVDFISKVFLRAFFWAIFLIITVILIVFVENTFNLKLKSDDFWKIVQSYNYYLYFIGIVIFSFFSDLVNKALPDTIQCKFIDCVTRIKCLNIGKHFIKLHINKSQNATIWSFHKIDDIINVFYKLNKGKLYLFNPPRGLLEASDEFKEIITAIKSNKDNIELVLIIPNSAYNPNKSDIAKKIGIDKIKLINNIPSDLKAYSESYVAGVYTGESTLFPKGKGTDIKYFLNRPLYYPYSAKFTIVQTKGDMEKIIFPNEGVGANNLNRLLEEYIAEIEKITE